MFCFVLNGFVLNGRAKNTHHHPSLTKHLQNKPRKNQKQNRLLKLEIIITVATISLALYNLVAGVLGENLVLPAPWTADLTGFVVINGSMMALCVASFFGIVAFMRRRKLI